jgi:hypothetical protein
MLWVFRARRSMVVMSLAVLFGSLAVNLVLTSKSQAAGFYLPLGRLWELAAGGLIACIQWEQRSRRVASAAPHGQLAPGVGNVLGWSGIGLLAATQVAYMDPKAFPGFHAIAVVAAAAMLVLAGPQAWFNRRVLSHPAVVYLGKLSYPLYLWHWPLLVFARLVGDGQWSSSHRNIAVVASVVLAMLTYHCVEKPLARRVARKNLMALVLAGLMVAVGTLAWVASQGKMPLVTPPYENAALQVYDKPAVTSQGKVMLLGDSNAGHLVYGLSLLYGDRVSHIATPGWPYLDGVRYRDGYVPHPEHVGTPQMTEQALRGIEADPDIRVVVLSIVHRMYFAQDGLRSVQGGGYEETAYQAYEKGLLRTVERLQRHNKKVVLVKAIPTYSSLLTVTACTSGVRPLGRREPAECTQPRAAVDAERREYDAIVQRVVQQRPGVRVFNTLDELCDARFCYVNRKGVQMYIDPGHFTTAGSQLMAAALARTVEDAFRSP